MKKLKIISGISFIVFCFSCGNNESPVVSTDSISIKKDSVIAIIDSTPGLNMIDEKGRRQGSWFITGQMSKNPAYSPETKVEEGFYSNDLRQGEWTEFNPDGSVKKKTNYKDFQDSMMMKSSNVTSSADKQNAKESKNINFIDANGKRQGHWIIYGSMQKDKSYSSDAKVEEGNYLNGERDGLWTTYNPDGSVKKTISIKNR